MADLCVLGGGLVGRFVASTLCKSGHDVRLIDADARALEGLPREIDTIHSRIDLSEDFSTLLAGARVVVNCLPGRFGHSVRESLLSIEGMLVADLAFTFEDPRTLDEFAKKNRSLMVYDVGIAPGLSNILIGMAQQEKVLDKVRIWVGGNPKEQDTMWSYMAPFSPADVIEEYTRPARIRREGRDISAPALTDRHIVDVPGYGQMEAFLTDGLRSLLDTIQCEDLAEYTVRWPGHIQKFIDLDEFDEGELIEAWKFDISRPEFTWLAVEVGSGESIKRWDVTDDGNEVWSSMARTTGLVTVEVVEMMLEGAIQETGVLPPEALHAFADRFIGMMQDNGVKIESHSSSW